MPNMRPRYLIIAATLMLSASLAAAQEPRQRWPGGSSSDGGGEAAPRTAVPRSEPARESPPPPPPPPPPAARPAQPSGGRAQPAAEPARPAGSGTRATAPAGVQRRAEPRASRPRGDNPQTGVAVPRGSVAPPPQRPVTVYVPQTRVFNNTYYYPYYPRRSYPYGYGSFGLGYFYYDPYTWYPYDTYNYRFRGYGYGYPTGDLRLDVRPRHAEVYVDGYYAGTVDDFDGLWQSLSLERGSYTIELVAPGYEPIVFDVRIQDGRKITYRGNMRRLRP
jgi:hypothetical protein